ncbi:hypothetical protein JCM10049v2_000114 [Rhodotorula toruloides]
MLSISVLPAELVLQILLDTSWCPGLKGPNPDVLRPYSLVCKSWYRLALPYLAQNVYALTPPRLVDPLDGVDRYRFVRSVAFSPAIPDLAVTDRDAALFEERESIDIWPPSEGNDPPEILARMLSALAQDTDKLHPEEAVALSHFKTAFAQDAAIKVAWFDFFSRCAPTLRRLDILAIDRWLEYPDESDFFAFQRSRGEAAFFGASWRRGEHAIDQLRRSRGRYALEHLQLDSLPVSGALTSLHIGICDDLDLEPFLKRGHLFPSLETLVIHHTVDAPNKPRMVEREEGNTFMHPLTVQILGVPNKLDFRYRRLVRAYAAPFASSLTCLVFEGGPVMSAGVVYPKLDSMFSEGLDFPRLESLSIRMRVFGKDRHLLRERFPNLRRLQLTDYANGKASCPELPSTLEYLDICCDDSVLPELRAMTSSLSRLRYFALRTSTFRFVPFLQEWAHELEEKGCTTHEAFDFARADEDHAAAPDSRPEDDTYEPSDDGADSDSSDDDLAPDMSNGKPWWWAGGPREELMERFLDVLQPEQRRLWGIEE